MKLGKITGRIVSSTKIDSFCGARFNILQPMNEAFRPIGNELVAIDNVNSHYGDIVYWVGGAEASIKSETERIPNDALIIGIVDKLHIKDTQ